MKKFLFIFIFSIVLNSFLFSQAACNNEDFESSTPGAITTTNGVSGWTITSGFNNTAGGSCILPNCCPSAPNAATIISTGSSGYIDPNIGPTYPIYSIYGSFANTGGTYGDKIIKLNDAIPNSGAHRIAKTINVIPSNCNFRFSFIATGVGGHPCCDAPIVKFRLINAMTGSVLACPQITDNYPASGCTGIGAGTYSTCPLNGSLAYHKWTETVFDLTLYIGMQMTFEAMVADCTTGGHTGYMYFDAQCGPMSICLNSGTICFACYGPSINIATCTSAGTASLTAPPGMTAYAWTGPGAFIPSSAQTITTTINGTYTLTMMPLGACAPTILVANLIIGSASVTAVSTNSLLCSGSTATLTASGVSTYSWNTGANTAAIAVSPTVTTTYTINGTDAYGCAASNTITQIVSTCTGIENLNITNGLVIYPNPNNGDFTLKIETEVIKAELRIENTLGQLVFSQTVSQGENKIKTKGLAVGIYYYSVTDNKKIIGKGKLKIE